MGVTMIRYCAVTGENKIKPKNTRMHSLTHTHTHTQAPLKWEDKGPRMGIEVIFRL